MRPHRATAAVRIKKSTARGVRGLASSERSEYKSFDNCDRLRTCRGNTQREPREVGLKMEEAAELKFELKIELEARR